MTAIIKKGENILLSKLVPDLKEIIVAVKWLNKANDSTKFAIDCSAFLLTEQNKIRQDEDFIFYNQPLSTDNAVILKNNLFKVDLAKIPNEIHKISFVLTLHEAKQHQHYFGLLDKIIIELFNFTDKQKIASYTVEDARSEIAIILGFIYRYQTEWKFRAVGQGYNDGLGVLAKNFGVTIAEEIAEQNSPEKKDVLPLKNNTIQESAVNEKSKLVNKKANNRAKLKLDELQQDSPATINGEKNAVVDIHNTDMMTKQAHYEPIVQWLKLKMIEAEVNEAAMDTSGFFDEIAIVLGDNYDLLKIVSNTIKRRQVNKKTAYINLHEHSPLAIGSIKKFCKQLYDFSFVAKYFYNSQDNKIILHLQSAVKITNFFNGEWLEWYAVMKIAKLCHEKNIPFSCTRNMLISMPNESHYEIDVFFLINEIPLFIECKSGEYRQFIDKYSRLRKKLAIPKPYFLFLTLGTENEHNQGLTAMFDITFINEKSLLAYVIDIFLKKKD